MILEYFDEDVAMDTECGACDNCVQRSADASAITLKMKVKAKPLFRKGDAVRVPKYGRGTVAEVHDDRIAVSFGSGETREFAPRYVAKARA
jgi:ATP-dependent DNA helicase RecQ